MPEISELKYMAKFINKASKGRTFNKIGISEVTKHPRPSETYEEFTVHAESRGKEMRITITPVDLGDPLHLIFSMGMTGHWEYSETLPKHAHFWFKETYHMHYLSFVDARRFGGWKEQESWSNNRGFDPTTEYSFFKEQVLNEQHDHFKGKRLYEKLMDQKYFNGIGNYLRAEILYRFYKEHKIMPTATFDDLEKNDLKELVKIIRDVCNESYKVGGGEFMSWENPEGKGSKKAFDKWLKCYRQKKQCYIKDKQGRTFWFHPECKEEFESLEFEVFTQS